MVINILNCIQKNIKSVKSIDYILTIYKFYYILKGVFKLLCMIKETIRQKAFFVTELCLINVISEKQHENDLNN